MLFIACIHYGLLARFDRPIDRGLKLAGKRLFGDNKTWRGVLIYCALAPVICALLWLLLTTPLQSFTHPVFAHNPLVLGMVYALSYTTGELLNSFMKRRLGIVSGGTAVHPFAARAQRIGDTLDGILVVTCALLVIYHVSVVSLLIGCVLSVAAHLGTDAIMRRVGLKQ